MVNFKSGKEECQVLTICKNGQDFKFEIETPRDFLNALGFMFEAEAAEERSCIPLDEAWSFQPLDRTGDLAISVIKCSAEKVFKKHLPALEFKGTTKKNLIPLLVNESSMCYNDSLKEYFIKTACFHK